MPVWKTTVSIDNAVLGGRGSNTWHARTLSAVGPGPEDAHSQLIDIQGWISNMYASMNPVICGGTTITGDGIWVSVDEAEASLVSVPGFTVGITGSAASLPPQDSIVLGWKTSSPTKGGRGRTFIGPLKASALQDNGTPTAEALANIRGSAEALVASSAAFADNGALGVYSRAGKTVGENGVLRDFVSVNVANRFASLRTRRD